MKRLTQMQVNHLIARADVLFGNIARDEKETLGPCPVIPYYTDAQKIELIRSKKATLQGDINQYSRTLDSFEYPVSPAQRRTAAQRKLWDARANAIDAKYHARKQNFIDVAILGDAEEALSALRHLETELTRSK